MRRRCQAAELVAARETGLMWAKALRAFQVGKVVRATRAVELDAAVTGGFDPGQPAMPLTKASASA